MELDSALEVNSANVSRPSWTAFERMCTTAMVGTAPPPKSAVRRTVCFTSAWFLYATLDAAPMLLECNRCGSTGAAEILLKTAIRTSLWIPLSVLFFVVAKRLLVMSGAVAWVLLFVGIVQTAVIGLAIEIAADAAAAVPSGAEVLVTSTFHKQLRDTFIVLLAAYSQHLIDVFTATRLKSAELERQLTDARYHALQSQIRPHFLFNVLHSISALVRRQPADAERMVTRLGDLLRLTLECGDTYEIQLSGELEFVRRYLDIEQVRFSDRLRVEWSIQPRALDVKIPVFILQPLVENSVKHGIARLEEGGAIEIAARLDGEHLVVTVADDGPAPPPDQGRSRSGVGIPNTRTRLASRYGATASLELTRRGGRNVAVMSIPVQPKSGYSAAFSS